MLDIASSGEAEPWTYAYFFSEDVVRCSDPAQALDVGTHDRCSSSVCGPEDPAEVSFPDFAMAATQTDLQISAVLQPALSNLDLSSPAEFSLRASSAKHFPDPRSNKSSKPAVTILALEATAANLRMQTQRLAEEVRVLRNDQRELQRQVKASKQYGLHRHVKTPQQELICRQVPDSEQEVVETSSGHHAITFGVANGSLCISFSDTANTLTFRKLRSMLRLTNVTSGHVAFKMRMTSPLLFSVWPTSGVLDPGGVAHVEIRLVESNVGTSGHLFLVLGAPALSSVRLSREQWAMLPKEHLCQLRLRTMLTESSDTVTSTRRTDSGVLPLTLFSLTSLVVVPAFSWFGSVIGRRSPAFLMLGFIVCLLASVFFIRHQRHGSTLGTKPPVTEDRPLRKSKVAPTQMPGIVKNIQNPAVR